MRCIALIRAKLQWLSKTTTIPPSYTLAFTRYTKAIISFLEVKESELIYRVMNKTIFLAHQHRREITLWWLEQMVKELEMVLLEVAILRQLQCPTFRAPHSKVLKFAKVSETSKAIFLRRKNYLSFRRSVSQATLSILHVWLVVQLTGLSSMK